MMTEIFEQIFDSTMHPRLLNKLNEAIDYHADNAKHFMARYGDEHDKGKDAKAHLKLSKFHYKIAQALAQLRDSL